VQGKEENPWRRIHILEEEHILEEVFLAWILEAGQNLP
jgi:hypothetical protein